MGCWNETCFYSNLPIRHGDPVVFFITACGGWEPDKHRDRASFCHPTDMEEPISLPIKASYNDYGSIESWDENDVAIRMVEKLFDEDFQTVLDRIMDHMRDDYGFTLKSNHRNQKTNELIEYPVSTLMMHATLYDKLIAKYAPKLREDIPEQDYHAIFESDEQKKTLTQKRDAGEKLTEAEEAILENNLQDILNRLASLGSPRDTLKWSGVNFRDLLKEVWLDTEKSERKNTVEQFLKLKQENRALDCSMSYLRKAYRTSSGCGSQAMHLRHHLDFADVVKEVALGCFDDSEELYTYMLHDDY